MLTGTHRNVSVVLGVITQPPPMPATASAGAIHQPTTAGGATHRTTTVADMPSTTSARPTTVSRRPQRVTSLPPTTAEAAAPSANGVTASPDCSGVKPSPVCRYSANTSQIPLNPTK
jgi:hypothetical protein